MNFTPSFNRRFLQFAIFLLGFYVITQFIYEFELLRTFNYDTGETYTLNLIIREFIWLMPLLAIFYFFSKDEQNKRPAIAAISILIVSEITQLFLKFQEINLIDDNNFFIALFGNVAAFLCYGYLKFENRGLWLGILGLIYHGLFISASTHEYASTLMDFFVELGIIEYRLGDYGSTSVFYFGGLFSTLKYLLLFGLFEYLKNQVATTKLLNFNLSNIILPERKINLVVFSLLFWSTRVYIMTALFRELPMYFIDSSLFFDGPFILKLTYAILCAITFYIVASFLRNLLIAVFAQEGKFPSWQFLWFNFPIINIIYWLIYAINWENKSNENPQLIDEVKQNERSLKISDIKDKFKASRKNRGIQVLIFSLFFLNVLLNFYALANAYRVSSIQVVIVLLSTIIGLSFILAYILHARALLVINLILVSLTFIILWLDMDEFMVRSYMTPIISLTLFHALFHFNQFKFYRKSGEQVEEIID